MDWEDQVNAENLAYDFIYEIKTFLYGAVIMDCSDE